VYYYQTLLASAHQRYRGTTNQWQQKLRVTYKILTEASVCEARSQSKPARYLRRPAQRRAQQRAEHGTNQILESFYSQERSDCVCDAKRSKYTSPSCFPSIPSYFIMLTAIMKPYVYSALNTYALAATPFNNVT
jgi:hypothetical protein